MLYFSIALVMAAGLVAFFHIRENRGKSTTPIVRWFITAVAIIARVATTVQVYRIGDSGARATWGNVRYIGSNAP
jgi:hypothetical protein